MTRQRSSIQTPRPRRAADLDVSSGHSALGARISARLGSLSGDLVTTATATYGRIGIGFVEAKVLGALGDGPATGAQISRCVGIDPAAISRAARGLIGRDLIFKSSDVASRLCLTDAGLAMLRPVTLLAESRGERLVAGLSQKEQAMLLDYLERLLENLPALALLVTEWQTR